MDQIKVGFIKKSLGGPMLWMYLVDPQNHILKVLCHNVEFGLSYSGSLNKLLTSEKREERERETGDFSGCFAKCYGWEKG